MERRETLLVQRSEIPLAHPPSLLSLSRTASHSDFVAAAPFRSPSRRHR